MNSTPGTVAVIDEYHLRVGDRVWWGEYFAQDVAPGEHMTMGWKVRQFIVRFESKWSVSIIWGYGTYSDNHNIPFGSFYDGDPPAVFHEQPDTVEAAVFHADRDKIQGNDGDPFGYIDAEQLNALLYHVSQLHTEDHFNSDRTSDDRAT